MGGVEELYKHFGTLADAKEKAGEVSEYTGEVAIFNDLNIEFYRLNFGRALVLCSGNSSILILQKTDVIYLSFFAA